MTSINIQLEILNPTKIENLINALDLLLFPYAKFNTLIMDSIVLTLTLLKYQSHHGFAMLLIRHLLDILMNTYIMEASVVISKNGDVAMYIPTTDYSCRPNSLEHLTLYEFTLAY
jgi:hypothetical protein